MVEVTTSVNPYDISPLLGRIAGMSGRASDLIFSPGHAPRTITNGLLSPFPIKEIKTMSPYQVEMLALSLLKNKPRARQTFLEKGSVDLSWSMEQIGRFRVNIFRQQNLPVVIMRLIPPTLPTFKSLNLPECITVLVEESEGLCLVTGLAGSGKSATLAAAVNHLNRHQTFHILTIEDPIEYSYPLERCIVHQREIGSDVTDVAEAMREALQQAPQVIMVSQLRNRECIELAMEAAERGCLVLAGLPSATPANTIDILLDFFPAERAHIFRDRLAGMLRCIASQRLIPRQDRQGLAPLVEVLRINGRAREAIRNGLHDENTLREIIRDGTMDGMQTFEIDLARLVKEELVTKEIAAQYAPPAIPRAEQEPNLGFKEPGGARRVIEMDEVDTLDRIPVIGLDEP